MHFADLLCHPSLNTILYNLIVALKQLTVLKRCSPPGNSIIPNTLNPPFLFHLAYTLGAVCMYVYAHLSGFTLPQYPPLGL